jgi:hypothetical protein
MRYLYPAAFCVGLLLCTAVSAATVDSIKGRILLNRGDGFQVLAAPTTANPGDKVMASPDGSAKLRYADGCVIDIHPKTVVSVGAKSPCTAPYLAGLGGAPVQEQGFLTGLTPFVLGAGAIVGIACAAGAEFCEGEEHHHHHHVTNAASP